jgi:hypothetical protein
LEIGRRLDTGQLFPDRPVQVLLLLEPFLEFAIALHLAERFMKNSIRPIPVRGPVCTEDFFGGIRIHV